MPSDQILLCANLEILKGFAAISGVVYCRMRMLISVHTDLYLCLNYAKVIILFERHKKIHFCKYSINSNCVKFTLVYCAFQKKDIIFA